jgi:hypothetical protein
MKTVFFLLLRLICYAALAILLVAAVALLIVNVNGQCPPVSELGVTCATKFSQRLADFAITVGFFTLASGVPAALALGGLIFLFIDLRRWRIRKSFSSAPS